MKMFKDVSLHNHGLLGSESSCLSLNWLPWYVRTYDMFVNAYNSCDCHYSYYIHTYVWEVLTISNEKGSC